MKFNKEMSRNPLAIIALFIILIYGFACLLFGLSVTSLDVTERLPLIWFVVLFPTAVLILFGWLVSKHHNKLYAPTDYRDDESFLQTMRAKRVTTYISPEEYDELLNY